MLCSDKVQCIAYQIFLIFLLPTQCAHERREIYYGAHVMIMVEMSKTSKA